MTFLDDFVRFSGRIDSILRSEKFIDYILISVSLIVHCVYVGLLWVYIIPFIPLKYTVSDNSNKDKVDTCAFT